MFVWPHKLSQSVVDAIRYLRQTNEDLEDKEATSEFISFISCAFDILNSQYKFSKTSFYHTIARDTN